MAFVDLQKFASKSVKAQTMQKKLMDRMNTLRTSLENKKKELADLQEQLQKQGPMLKEDTRNQKIKEIGIKEMEFKLAEKEAQNSLQNEERDTMESFQRDLTKIIARIRAQKGLMMVFNQAALLSADDALDITDEVAKAYDAEAAAPAAPAPKKAPAAGPALAPAAPEESSSEIAREVQAAPTMNHTLEELARFLGATSSETPGPAIAGVRPLEYARENDITYVAGPQFLEKLAKSSAGAVILSNDLDPGGRPYIRSDNPEAAFARLTGLFYPVPCCARGHLP